MNATKARRDATRREAAKVAKVALDLCDIAAEVSALEVAEIRDIPLAGPGGFDRVPLRLLAVPRTRGRWPVRLREAEEDPAAGNWSDLTDSDARRHYRAAGPMAKWMAMASALNHRVTDTQRQQPITPEQWEEWMSPDPRDDVPLWALLKGKASAAKPCVCRFCTRSEAQFV